MSQHGTEGTRKGRCAVGAADDGLGSYRRSFRPEVGAAAAARRDLEDLCADVDDDVLDRGLLAMTEVMTNSVKHAQLRPSQLIDVDFELLAAVLRVEVTDNGVGFEPPAAGPAQGNAGGGGWGLWLVDQLADRWGVAFSHSTRVWLEFDRNGS